MHWILIYTLALASAVSLACLTRPGGASPRGMYTSINLSLLGLLNSASSSSLESSSGVWTAIDSYGVYFGSAQGHILRGHFFGTV